MILLSEASFTCCSTEALRAETIVIAHMGQHELKGIDMGAVHMYTAVTRGLLIHRLPFLGPVRRCVREQYSLVTAAGPTQQEVGSACPRWHGDGFSA
jgi:hypothetical protein